MGQEIALPENLMVPRTGELLPATTENAITLHQAYTELIRELESWKKECDRVLAAEAQRQGSKTLYFGDYKVVLTGGVSITFRGQERELMAALMEVGCPPDRVTAAVQEVVSYKVDRRVITQLKAANPHYKQAIEASEREVETQWKATVSRK